MTYSYSQISQYLACPRRYRHRYLDGWREKDTRAAMVFGRVFEKALAAYFQREDSGAVLFQEWGAYRGAKLEYAPSDTWDRMAHQGVTLLERFAQDDRVRIRQPRRNLQIKLTRQRAAAQEQVRERLQAVREAFYRRARDGLFWEAERLTEIGL